MFNLRSIVRKKSISREEKLNIIRANAEREPVGKAREFIERRLSVAISKFRDHTAYLSMGSGKVWATFRACHITAAAFSTTVFKIQNMPGARTGQPGIQTLGDLGKLLLTPNPYDSWEELIYQWVFHMKLTGNAYWLKDEITMGSGKPSALYPLLPQCIEIIPDAKKKVAMYKYRVNGIVLEFKPEEIIHFRRPHPSDIHIGLGDVEGGIDLYEDYVNRGSLQEKFIENGAMPSGILTREDADDLDETDWGRLKAEWVAKYSGTKNAGKTAFLSGKWKYHRMGLSHQEMQDIEQAKYTIDQIFINHGVPLSIAGIREAANFATARQEDVNFRKYEIVPLIDLFVGKLNMEGSLVKLFNRSWVMAYELSGLIDVEQTWRDYGGFFLNGGITANELRVLMGLAKADNPLLDQFYVPMGRIPIEMSGLSDLSNNGNGEGDDPPPPEPGNGPGQANDTNKHLTGRGYSLNHPRT